MNLQEEALNLAAQVECHDPRRPYDDPRRPYDDPRQPYDLTGQQPSWKDASESGTAQTNGRHVKEVMEDERGREEEEEEEEEEEVARSDDGDFSESSHGSEDEEADVEDEGG